MDLAATAVINYLEQRAEIDQVLVRDKGKCSSDAFINWEERNGCELPEDLKMFYLMSDGLEIRWSINPGSKNSMPMFLGKMFINSLNDLNKIVTTGSKQTALDELNDFADIERLGTPRFNSTSWSIFELDPCDGQGRVCLVYHPEGDAQIWFLDRSLHFHRIASTFTEYYRILLLHCGLPLWQYKYTDVGVPPYILHWYYTITPSLFLTRASDEPNLMNFTSFNADKLFQRNNNAAAKNTKTTNPPSVQTVPAARSATQSQKRPIQPNKSINRSSSVPRSMNN